MLLKSVPNLPKFDNPKALIVWHYKVAKNRWLMSRRKSKFAPKEDLSLEELMPDRRELERLSGNAEGTPETSLMRREMRCSPFFGQKFSLLKADRCLKQVLS